MDKRRKHINKDELLQQDFEKYLKGELSHTEQHRIEKILLESDFENEAMQGFSGVEMEEAAKDMEVLREQLQRKTRRKKKNMVWIRRIAATVLLLALFSFALYYMLESKQKEELISLGEKAIPEGKGKGSAVPFKMQEEPSEVIKDVVIADASAPENEKVKEDESGDSSLDGKFDVEAAKKPAVIDEKQPMARINIKREYHLEAIDDNEEDLLSIKQDALSGAENEEDQSAARSTIAEEFAGRKETDANVRSKRVSETRPVSESNIALSPEISKSEYSGNTGDILVGNNKKTPLPVGGKNAFKEYLKESIHYPADKIDEGKKGTVVVGFTVSTSAKIKNLHIEKSMGDIFDREAVRLILEGPTWKPAVENGVAVEKEVRVRIRFSPPLKDQN